MNGAAIGGLSYDGWPRANRLATLREGIRHRRQERARRAHALRASGARVPYVPGSEHTHLLPRGKGF